MLKLKGIKHNVLNAKFISVKPKLWPKQENWHGNHCHQHGGQEPTSTKWMFGKQEFAIIGTEGTSHAVLTDSCAAGRSRRPGSSQFMY
jgi:hypothetical protein